MPRCSAASAGKNNGRPRACGFEAPLPHRGKQTPSASLPPQVGTGVDTFDKKSIGLEVELDGVLLGRWRRVKGIRAATWIAAAFIIPAVGAAASPGFGRD